jgi:hypothetical protein
VASRFVGVDAAGHDVRSTKLRRRIERRQEVRDARVAIDAERSASKMRMTVVGALAQARRSAACRPRSASSARASAE